jgi:hypothetical protein
MRKTKVMGISIHPSTLQIMIDKIQPENVEYFKYLGSMITNDAKLNPGFPGQKRHIKKRLFTLASWT